MLKEFFAPFIEAQAQKAAVRESLAPELIRNYSAQTKVAMLKDREKIMDKYDKLDQTKLKNFDKIF